MKDRTSLPSGESPMKTLLPLLGLTFFLIIGCTDLENDQYIETTDKILNGQLTSTRPEVGMVVINKGNENYGGMYGYTDSS